MTLLKDADETTLREALRALSEAAFMDINHLLRPQHLASLKSIVEDPEASDNDKFVARVTMNIDSRYKFPQDTSASILTAGLLGEQYVGFEGGAEDKALAPGATLKLTQSAVVLEKLISQFMYNKAAEGSGSSK